MSMADTKILSEKLKYLIGQENRDFEILSLDVDYYNGISGYSLYIMFDYLGAIDSEVPHFFGDVAEIIEEIQKTVSHATITPEKKISLSQQVFVQSSLDKIEFVSDTKHVFTVSFLVHYIDKN
jgi:hypothetical protein